MSITVDVSLLLLFVFLLLSCSMTGTDSPGKVKKGLRLLQIQQTRDNNLTGFESLETKAQLLAAPLLAPTVDTWKRRENTSLLLHCAAI